MKINNSTTCLCFKLTCKYNEDVLVVEVSYYLLFTNCRLTALAIAHMGNFCENGLVSFLLDLRWPLILLLQIHEQEYTFLTADQLLILDAFSCI